MLQLITMFRSLTKKQWIIIGLILLIIVLSIILRPKSSPAPTLISPDIPSFFSPNPAALTPTLNPSDQTSAYPKTITTFLSSTINESVAKEFFQPILVNLNISASPTSQTINDLPYLLWRENNNYIDVTLSNGWFSLRTNAQIDPKLQTSIELDIQNLAINWLKNNQLLNDNYDLTTEYLAFAGDELETASTSAGAQFYRFFITPKVNQLPLFSPDDSAPIVITYDHQGHLFSLNYQLPLNFFSQVNKLQASAKKVKTDQQISAAITSNQPVISQIKTLETGIISSEDQLQAASYQPGPIGYLPSYNTPQLIPVIQLSGSITTTDNLTTNVTAYLPALAN